jgi:hypothetical protein
MVAFSALAQVFLHRRRADGCCSWVSFDTTRRNEHRLIIA